LELFDLTSTPDPQLFTVPRDLWITGETNLETAR
jgi:hypothetical protein